MKNVLAKLEAIDRVRAVTVAVRRGIIDMDPWSLRACRCYHYLCTA